MAVRSSKSDAALRDAAEDREAELVVRREPVLVDADTHFAEFGEHVIEILRDEMRQHEAIVQIRTPASQLVRIRVFPEAGDEGPQEELLHQAHAGMRRHFEAAELDQPQPAAAESGE